jgi:hypothetical protein
MGNLDTATLRSEQQKAARLLIRLLRAPAPLPAAYWTISAVDGHLTGLVTGDGDEARKNLAAWAHYLGGTVAEEQDSSGCLRGYVRETDLAAEIWAEIEPPENRRCGAASSHAHGTPGSAA